MKELTVNSIASATVQRNNGSMDLHSYYQKLKLVVENKLKINQFNYRIIPTNVPEQPL